MTETYDLIIIGGGAGAFAAAIQADELGAQILLVNTTRDISKLSCCI